MIAIADEQIIAIIKHAIGSSPYIPSYIARNISVNVRMKAKTSEIILDGDTGQKLLVGSMAGKTPKRVGLVEQMEWLNDIANTENAAPVPSSDMSSAIPIFL